MRRFLIILMLLIGTSLFAGYKLVLRNGAVMELKSKPDLSGKMVTGETVDGKRIIVPARIIDMAATQSRNQAESQPAAPVPAAQEPVTPEPEPSPAVVEPVSANVTPVADETTEKPDPLIITNETIIRAKPAASPTEQATKPAEPPTTTGPEEVSSSGDPADGQRRDRSGRTESYWRGRFEANRSATLRAEEQLQKVQVELNRLFSARLNTDDELARRRLNEDIDQLNEIKERTEKQLSTLRAENQDLFKEARRSGALPGWYRDYDD